VISDLSAGADFTTGGAIKEFRRLVPPRFEALGRRACAPAYFNWRLVA